MLDYPGIGVLNTMANQTNGINIGRSCRLLHRLCLSLAISAALGGCAVGPDFKSPIAPQAVGGV